MVWTDSQDYGADEILYTARTVLFDKTNRLMREIAILFGGSPQLFHSLPCAHSIENWDLGKGDNCTLATIYNTLRFVRFKSCYRANCVIRQSKFNSIRGLFPKIWKRCV